MPVRREGIIRWHALPGQGTRRLICLILALGLLLESAQAQLQPPPFRWASRAGSAGSEDLRDMAVDPAGNSVIVGNLNPGSPTTFGTITVNLPVGSIGGYFAKYDSSGNAIWVRTVQGTLVAGAHRVALDAAGNVYVLGPFAGNMTIGQFTFQSSVNSRDVYIAKLDPDGNVLWARAFGGPLNETTNPSATAGMAGLALSGTNLFSTFDFGGSLQIDLGGGNFQVLSSQGGQDVAVVKLDLAGNYLDSTQFGGLGNDAPRSLTVDSQGDVVVLAVSDGDIALGVTTGTNLVVTTVTNRGGTDVVMAKFTQALQPVWLRSFGSASEDGPLGLATDPSDNIIVSGYAAADLAVGNVVLINQGAFDAFIAKFSPAGQLIWTQRGLSTDTNNEVGFFVTTDAGGYIYLNGQFDSTDIRFGAVALANSSGTTANFVVKFDPNGTPLWGQTATATIGFNFTGRPFTTSIFGACPRLGYDQLGRFYLAGRYEGVARFGTFTLNNAGNGDIYIVSLDGDFSILQHPQNLFAKQGDTATFSVVTSTNVPLNFQWLYNGLPIFGANGTNYSITNAQTANSGLYSVVVSAFTGVLISSNATLVVKLPPVITQNPLSRTVTAGSTVTLFANGTGDAPLSFRWFFNGNALDVFTTSLTLTNVQLANAGLYSLQVSNEVGAVFSADAGLFVNSPPVVVSHPTNHSVTLGSNVTFNVASAGLPPFTYQWRHDGDPIPGANNQSFTITGTQLSDAGIYDVLVGNALSSVFSSNALLTVFNPFSVGATSFQPGGLFQMTASGDNGRSYRMESSTNLVIWTAVVTNTVSGGTATFTDSTAAGKALSFYRIVLLP